MVMTEVRRYMEAAVEKLTPARAQEMARTLVQGQGQRKEQVQKVAQDLMDWSNQTRDRLSEMIRREVARQLEAMGVASRRDVEALEKRVRTLERGAARPAGAKPGAKTSTAKTSTAKTSASKAAPARPRSPRGNGGPPAGSGKVGS